MPRIHKAHAFVCSRPRHSTAAKPSWRRQPYRMWLVFRCAHESRARRVPPRLRRHVERSAFSQQRHCETSRRGHLLQRGGAHWPQRGRKPAQEVQRSRSIRCRRVPIWFQLANVDMAHEASPCERCSRPLHPERRYGAVNGRRASFSRSPHRGSPHRPEPHRVFPQWNAVHALKTSGIIRVQAEFVVAFRL